MSVKISTSYSITRCNSMIRVGNSSRGQWVRNTTQRIQTLFTMLQSFLRIPDECHFIHYGVVNKVEWMAVIKSRNEWLSYNLGYQLHAVSYNTFATAASYYVIKTEPNPFYTTLGHLNVGSAGRLVPTTSRKMPGKGSYLIKLSCHNLTSISPGMLPNLAVRECMFDSSPANHFSNP